MDIVKIKFHLWLKNKESGISMDKAELSFEKTHVIILACYC